MRPARLALALGLALAAPGVAPAQATDEAPEITADHTKFEALQGPFESGPEVTEACLSCHTEAASQVHDSIHWTWEFEHPETGQTLGKRHVINAFCGNVATNEPRCTSCHAGYGWEETETFDFASERNVDCLACHDTTGTYVKWMDRAGHPIYEPEVIGKKHKPYAQELITALGDGRYRHEPPDLAMIARSVGQPGRQTCGNCHFYGGGGDNVKHGDLSSALVDPPVHVDVHMSPEGANMVCTDCHTAKGHEWPGSRYLGTVKDERAPIPGRRRPDVASCDSCHGRQPHDATTLTGLKLDGHTDRIACQTCHIPEFAKGGVATKTWWDWSTAGRLKNGEPYAEEGPLGRHTYLSTKGDFAWGENVEPDYAFWNGVVEYTLLGEDIEPEGVVGINRIHGGPDDPDSVIYPFKRMRGKQAYDKVHEHLLLNQVWGPDTDTALWTNFDYSKSLARGMEATDVPYSGEYAFVETEMWWPTTHMVAPASEALECDSCHAKEGRLAGVAGIYLPGRDGFETTDKVGLAALAVALAGVLFHGGLRIVLGRRRRDDGEE
jgi:octaheme c-type cytochrome (tetrathionate reductase family)